MPKRHVGLLARTLSVICSANAIQVTSCREHAILQGLFQGSLHDFLLLMSGRHSVGFLLVCCDELEIQPDHCVFSEGFMSVALAAVKAEVLKLLMQAGADVLDNDATNSTDLEVGKPGSPSLYTRKIMT